MFAVNKFVANRVSLAPRVRSLERRPLARANAVSRGVNNAVSAFDASSRREVRER